MSGIEELRIHLGAHKTATTHLQDTLAAHREAMLAFGVDYIPRADFGPLQRRHSRPNGWRRALWPDWHRMRFEGGLEKLRRGPGCVLLSDEDLLGYTNDQLAAPLYPDLPALPLLRPLLRGRQTVLFLAIRSLDGLVPSAYAQTLKALPQPPGTMDQIRRTLMQSPPSWFELIERLQRELPGCHLRVWLYEDYRTHWRSLLTTFAGRDVGEFPDLPPPPRTASPSPAAIEKAEKLDPRLPMRTRIATVVRYYVEMPAGKEFGRYAPLSPNEVERLRAGYAQDIAAIEDRFPGMLIRPGHSGS